eukprot:CAMPEP_0206321178 /NCGR_PEP_ID=MMETSP0106_2-20121207/18733_1 /ASSEMBLY_ACC=CAM_ASM_000206 /TAXON_ID=81532 /ORGANISM="Acanthoeca-like sp., Strain 10tr" /LENGTH=56 /DNA_ID=CAMNT_0053753225 /DNA_START=57 /DNA_END=224 /DNA_ORIENTATION=-
MVVVEEPDLQPVGVPLEHLVAMEPVEGVRGVLAGILGEHRLSSGMHVSEGAHIQHA